MKFSDEQEVIDGIKKLINDNSATFEIYGSTVTRIEVLIAIYLGIKKFNISNFLLVFSGWYKLKEEFKSFKYRINKFELDMDCWISCGPISGKFITIDQAYMKLASLDNADNNFWFKIIINE